MFSRLLSLFRRRILDRQLDDEIAAHLALQEAEFRASGMPAEAARAKALREFGGVTQTREEYRERRGLSWIDIFARDIQYALRGLRRNPGFTAAAVLSLAIGIGANTAIFSMFRALLLRMLPVARPEELVSLYRTGGWGRGFTSWPFYLTLRDRHDLFQDVAARSSIDEVRFQTGAGDRLQKAQ